MRSLTRAPRSIDLNADLGEYTGVAGQALDFAILDLVSSASIACGAHAGDPDVMQRTADAAFIRRVAIGAHPGYPDRQGFGRREIRMSRKMLTTEIISQIDALAGCCARAGTRLNFVKPHGALYNLAARDPAVARLIAQAVRAVDSSLVLLGLAGSELIREGERAGLAVACEAFADRAYLPTGALLPRDREGAVLDDANAVARRSLAMAREGYVNAVDGTRLEVNPDSLCVHGDNPHALALLRAVRSALEGAGFTIEPFAK